MPTTSTALPSRRHLFTAAGAFGLATLASLSLSRPAHAAGEWTEEFLTRPETREGFSVDAMDDWQIDNAKLIIAVVKGHGLGRGAARITLITAIVESWLYNYDPAVDKDSGGLFQQRPSMGWGTAAEVRHKQLAIDGFLGLGTHADPPGLLDLSPSYQDRDPGDAAQAVQASAHPDRYAQQIAAADVIWDRYADDVAPFG